MKPIAVITTLTLVLGHAALTGCSPAGPRSAAEAAADSATPAAADAAADTASPATVNTAVEARAIDASAPAFAVYMPGAEVSGAPVLAMGPAGPGGMVEFSIAATPDEVIDFYRQKADAAGLPTMATMSRDGTLSYTAGDGLSDQGQLLNVVATPADGRTNVHLDWSAGR
jgi:hypothetical protein